MIHVFHMKMLRQQQFIELLRNQVLQLQDNMTGFVPPEFCSTGVDWDIIICSGELNW